MEVGSLLQFVLYEHSDTMASVKEISLVERFDQLKSGYTQLLLLSHLLALIDGMAAYSPGAQLYTLLFGSLQWLEKRLAVLSEEEKKSIHSNPAKNREFFLLLLFFRVRLLRYGGLLGDLDHCSRCGVELTSGGGLDGELSLHCASCGTGYSGDFGLFRKELKMPLLLRFGDMLSYLEKSTSPEDMERILHMHNWLDKAWVNYTGKKPTTMESLYGRMHWPLPNME